MNEPNVRLSSPWVEYFNKINAMFKDDPDIKIVYNEDKNAINLYVDGSAKAEALAALLPAEKSFGNVTVTVSVIPSNEPRTKIGLFRDAFQGNPAFSYSITLDNVFTNPISYVVFRNKVVQFFNDDLSDPHGLESTLYEFIAEELFAENHDGICFSTDIQEPVYSPSLGKPLGEWP